MKYRIIKKQEIKKILKNNGSINLKKVDYFIVQYKKFLVWDTITLGFSSFGWVLPMKLNSLNAARRVVKEQEEFNKVEVENNKLDKKNKVVWVQK